MEGSLPDELVGLDLTYFSWYAASLCAPDDPVLHSWLSLIRNHSPSRLVAVMNRARLVYRNPLVGMPLVTVTFALSSPGSGPPSQSLTIDRILPVEGSVSTAISDSP